MRATVLEEKIIQALVTGSLGPFRGPDPGHIPGHMLAHNAGSIPEEFEKLGVVTTAMCKFAAGAFRG